MADPSAADLSRPLTTPARLAVLASGGGTNLQALLDRFNRSADPVARVEVVVGSRAGIRALDRAAAAGVPSRVIDPAATDDGGAAALLGTLEHHTIDLVVLAGYLKLVPQSVVERYARRMVNIHPALLPSFGGPGMYGLRVHRAVLESGATVSGATVHLVGERYDEGPILAQWPVPVLPGDTPETLAARVLRVEHVLFPTAIEALLAGGDVPPLPDTTIFALEDAAAPPAASLRHLFGTRTEP